MTKADIAKRVFERLHRLQAYPMSNSMTPGKAMELLELVLKILKETLDSGEDLKITGFGSFLVKQKNPRRGRNPQTGESIMLDGRRIVTFKPSTLLRKAVNGDSKG